MDIRKPLPLLGGLAPEQFMRTYWQKKPLLVRQAIPGFIPPVNRSKLFELASSDDAESRLVQVVKGAWKVQQGPFARRALPALTRPDWTLLVQGVDLHHDAVYALVQQFQFIPAARLDDLMISYASPGGGVGPHFDSYDVFLLQAQGHRRWRIGRQRDLTLRDDIPLKVLANFEPEDEFVLEPGDLLYLPPRYAHDGVAQDECMTYSIGFRAPARAELAQELLARLGEDAGENDTPLMYRDPKQLAVTEPAAIPAGLRQFAQDALTRALAQPWVLERALGEYLTEPKAQVYFEPALERAMLEGVRLDRRSRMMYDEKHIFINGESYRAAGRDASLMQQLANTRCLTSRDLAKASDDALELLSSWCDAGWAHALRQTD